MAGTGLGLFLPGETAYKDPGRFRDVLEAEGNKEAKYLASMDQFFAQLEETEREFNITADMKESFFEEEMAFKEEKLDWQSGENELDRALSRWTVGEQTDVQRMGIQEQGAYHSGMLDIGSQQLELGREKLSFDQEESRFLRGLYRNQERRTQETHDTAKNLLVPGDNWGSTEERNVSGGGGSSRGSDMGDIYFNPDTNTYSNTPVATDHDEWYNF